MVLSKTLNGSSEDKRNHSQFFGVLKAGGLGSGLFFVRDFS
jgi:hypothetical protein